MLLFGGDAGAGASSANSLYILDVPSMTWSEGPSAPEARSEMACSIPGDNFIVWGGYRGFPSATSASSNGASTTPLIYNMYIGEWTTTYVVRTSPGATLSGGKTAIGDGGGNAAAIGGGVAGAVAVIVVIGFLARRRHQRQIQHSSTKGSEMTSTRGHDPVLASTDNTKTGAVALREFSEITTSKHDINSKVKIELTNSPQNVLSSPHSDPTSLQGSMPSWSPTSTHALPESPLYMSSPVIPLRPSFAFSTTYSHDHIHRSPQQSIISQEQVDVAHNSSPQYDPTVAQTLLPSTVRNPQGITGIATVTSDQELLEQINSLQAEWIRRQAKNQS
ncbi:hypothetical protein BG015_001903 [Linnemannia schmuckeri]|uniref:Galactose oxidase n=1 Tax=Linnemannia schmuckeri TaxID=64567 RepID=A0A9P5S3B2_9FUNG|nr:hypothetical protein BG015_001903 [Linnemannia schmuckeri]